MYEIPTSVIIEDKSYTIREKGDFRMVLDCFKALEDEQLTKQERLISSLIIFYEDVNSLADIAELPDLEKAVTGMYDFFNCGETDPLTKNLPYKLIDWEKDSQLVSSAVNKVANKEVRLEEYIHWWTFVGYYMAIGESLLSSIISIRHKIMTGEKLEKYERKFRLENPQYFNWNYQTLEQREAENLIHELWNSG